MASARISGNEERIHKKVDPISFGNFPRQYVEILSHPGHGCSKGAFFCLLKKEHLWDAKSIKYVQGDLFTCPETDSLAHCISEDCHMSAGIAAIFKKKFGGVQELLNQHKKTGDVAILKRETRYIYYLISKNKYFHKPTYDNLRRSLEAMKIHCLKNAVTHISMPKIGCGLDRLDWKKVSAILEVVFEDTNIYITVYTL